MYLGPGHNDASVIAMKSSFIGVQRYIALPSPSGTTGRVLYVVARTRVNPGNVLEMRQMEDVSSFGMEMIFHPRTDWEPTALRLVHPSRIIVLQRMP